jgi:hypothetical protein
MDMSDYYYQCRFEQPTPDGIIRTVAWIESRGAKVGAKVELKGEDGLWTVTTVSNIGIDRDEYLKRVAKSRTKFASIQGGAA